ncbi:MAG: EAL domain-containing protein [Pacificimonas sp.]
MKLRERPPEQPDHVVSRPSRPAFSAFNQFLETHLSGNDLGDQNPEVLKRALADQLAKRMPFVYAIALVNLLLIAEAFYGTVSHTHLVIVSGPLIIIALIRAVYWHPTFMSRRSDERVANDVDRLPVTGTLVAAGLMVFAISLYPFGDLQQQSLIHYIATLTSFVGILGLNPSPKTALGMTLVSVIPSVVMFIYFGHPNALPISITMTSVSFLLFLIARAQHSGFIDLVRSQANLQMREREAATLNQKLHAHAYVDELTQIANRRSLFEQFERRQRSQNESAAWFGLIDLDGFKSVNDLFGHQAGDTVLRAVARRIAACDDVIECGRLGGDEFAFLLSGTLSPEDAIARSEKLAQAIARPIQDEAQILTVTASIGLRHTHGLSINECLERAYWALYEAKQENSPVKLFSADDEDKMRTRNRISNLFDSADLASQLSVTYQPIIDYDRDEIQSVEILARWTAEDGTSVMPDVFIPLAENTHRTTELTKIVIAKAISELPQQFSGLSLHINLSAKDITDRKFIKWLLASNAFKTVGRNQVILELTETAILAAGTSAAESLNKLRAAGFRIALDDFGVGQSSLARIHRLPLDQIKIDKSFCSAEGKNEHGWAIIATIFALSRQIGLECILEGIETEEQALRARALGVRLMQGYYFAKPMHAGHFRDVNLSLGTDASIAV